MFLRCQSLETYQFWLCLTIGDIRFSQWNFKYPHLTVGMRDSHNTSKKSRKRSEKIDRVCGSGFCFIWSRTYPWLRAMFLVSGHSFVILTNLAQILPWLKKIWENCQLSSSNTLIFTSFRQKETIVYEPQRDNTPFTWESGLISDKRYTPSKAHTTNLKKSGLWGTTTFGRINQIPLETKSHHSDHNYGAHCLALFWYFVYCKQINPHIKGCFSLKKFFCKASNFDATH